jgi:putative peptidoglycan lipid II flippase
MDKSSETSEILEIPEKFEEYETSELVDFAGVKGSVDTSTPNKKSSFAKNSLMMMLGTLLSRGTGMLRSILLVAALGATGLAADAFTVANNIPTMLAIVMSSGVLDAVLLPQIVRAFRSKSGDVKLNKLLTLAGMIMLSITVILTMLAVPLVHIFVGAWPDEQYNLAIVFAFVCIPQVFFYGMYSLLGQVLVAKEKFAPYMWAPIANNVISCIGLGAYLFIYGRASNLVNTILPGSVNDLPAWGSDKVFLVAGCATLGIAAQTAILLVALAKSGFKWHFKLGIRGIGLRKTSNIAIWSFLYIALGQAVGIIASRVASTAPTAQNAIDGVAGNAAYTQILTIYILPHAIVTVSIVTALYTKLAKSVADGNRALTVRHFSRGIRITAVWTFLAAFMLIIMPIPIVKLLLPSVTHHDCSVIATGLSMIAFRLVPLAILMIIERTFYAFEDAKSVFVFSIPDALIQIAVILIAFSTLSPQYWGAGICLSGAISCTVAALINFAVLKRHLPFRDGRRILRLLARALVAALLAALAGKLVFNLLNISEYITWLHALLSCILIGTAMSILYYILMKIMRVREIDEMLRPAFLKVAKVYRSLSKKLLQK